jgi:hypothetical protein
MLQQLAKQSGLKFENNGVNTKLADPYYWGSPWKQMKEIIDGGGIYGAIDNGTLAIWPKGGHRAARRAVHFAANRPARLSGVHGVRGPGSVPSSSAPSSTART